MIIFLFQKYMIIYIYKNYIISKMLCSTVIDYNMCFYFFYSLKYADLQINITLICTIVIILSKSINQAG